jgi:hypothetical protein
VRTGMTAPANVYRAIGRSRFDDDKVCHAPSNLQIASALRKSIRTIDPAVLKT